jgi:protein-S-isoprenylcysteine O-methyltransferase Ste14
MSAPAYALLALLLIGLAFISFRIFIRRSYSRKGRLTWLSTFLEFLVFSLFGAFTWLDLPADWPPAHVRPIVRTIGWIGLVLGLCMMLILISWFGWRQAMGQKVDGLKQSGPYRISRNPQIIACFIAVLGYALLWPSWHTLGWMILFSLIAHMMVITEEEHLRHTFGEAYTQYCAQVPRYLGAGKKRS